MLLEYTRNAHPCHPLASKACRSVSLHGSAAASRGHPPRRHPSPPHHPAHHHRDKSGAEPCLARVAGKEHPKHPSRPRRHHQRRAPSTPARVLGRSTEQKQRRHRSVPELPSPPPPPLRPQTPDPSLDDPCTQPFLQLCPSRAVAAVVCFARAAPGLAHLDYHTLSITLYCWKRIPPGRRGRCFAHQSCATGAAMPDDHPGSAGPRNIIFCALFFRMLCSVIKYSRTSSFLCVAVALSSIPLDILTARLAHRQHVLTLVFNID
ncbi:hypothetical protein CTRI78_v001661 [Colletotrichum trifolii]|uniref:Uncharacterized protein n=1 Tax=Colletotrichum trifolii TaxID=5466 RepID=A0A4R8RNQ8_COLTR|nr:hypothetical protein CTRI78_v001661 [Colletotrichum trifolii]